MAETKPPRDPAGGQLAGPSQRALCSIDCAVLAYCSLLADAADPLEPEEEQRLLGGQALLGDRVAPLLLRCLQMWERGAQRLVSCARAAGGGAAGWA